MAIVKMQKISICAEKKNRKAILELLQAMEVMEVRAYELDDPDLKRMDTQTASSTFDKNAEALEKAAEVLGKYAPEKRSGLSLFAEKDVVYRSEYAGIAANSQQILEHAFAVLRAEKEISECRGAIAANENLKASLQPWEKLDVPMESEGTRDTALFIGSMQGKFTESALTEQLAAAAGADVPFDLHVLSSENGVTTLTVLCLRRNREAVDEALRAAGFARPAQATRGIPRETAEACDRDTKLQQEKIETRRKKIMSFAKERNKFLLVSDYYRTRAEKYRLLGTIPQSESVFFLTGYVPADDAGKVRRILSERFGAVVEEEKPSAGETEPTLLRNNRFSASTEGVLESYGLPKHGKVDPTFIMSIFYVFFFGMMLSDAAYGIIISLLCGIILLKHKRMGAGMQRMMRLMFWCGLSTAFWGFMYGGFFGDAIDVVAKTFFGYTGPTPILKPIWFAPLENPMRLLLWCMLFGIIHLFTGLAIKGYQMLREGDKLGFVCDILAWYLFLIGLILMLLPTTLFESIAQMKFTLPAWLSKAAVGMTVVGLVIILFMAGRRKKNHWVLRIALGAYDIYGVTSWLSDVLSYSRLLALGLATGVIASVVNMIASMFGGGVVGAIIFILVFLLGHLLNIAINLLGAYVHTNRLQFVEFFGKFYDAGGEPFRPFGTRNRHIEIKEEKGL